VHHAYSAIRTGLTIVSLHQPVVLAYLFAAAKARRGATFTGRGIPRVRHTLLSTVSDTVD